MRGIVALLWTGLVAVPATAAVRRVPSEYATINAALGASSSGDSVLVAPGTYSDYEVRVLQGGGPFTASSVAFLKGGVSLIGEGGREVTRIDLAGQGVGRAVPVLAYGLGPGTVLVEGFTITGAPVGNAGMWSRFMDRMIIRGCRFEDLDGSTVDSGGLTSETADLELYHSEFLNCRAAMGAFPRVACVQHIEGDVILEGCVFENALAPFIVDLDAIGVSPPFGAVVRGCEFRDNTGLAGRVVNYVTLTVEDCVFVGNTSSGASALVISGGPGGIIEPGPYTVRRNLFAGNSTTSGLGTFNWDRVSGVIEQNTFVGNQGRGLTLTYEADHIVEIRRNVFAWMSGVAIKHASASPPPTLACNDFWQNTGGNTEGFLPGPTDLFLDPLFCDRIGGNYTLAANSPCLPPQSGACGQIGAFGEGCSKISVEPESWGKTKAKYRAQNGRREEP